MRRLLDAMTLGTATPASLSVARASSSQATTIDEVTPHVDIIPRNKKTDLIVKKPSCVFLVILFCKNGELLRSIVQGRVLTRHSPRTIVFKRLNSHTFLFLSFTTS